MTRCQRLNEVKGGLGGTFEYIYKLTNVVSKFIYIFKQGGKRGDITPYKYIIYNIYIIIYNIIYNIYKIKVNKNNQ